MRKILILGAGVYQVPLIKRAREMGLYTIVSSRSGNYPGFREADEVWEIDTTDRELLLREAEKARIDGVVTAGTDVAVRSIGYINDALGLNGISGWAAKLLTDKALMKEAFLKNGVRTTPFRKVAIWWEKEEQDPWQAAETAMGKTAEAAVKAADEIGYPVMVKACDVSGSRGVTRAEDEWEVRKAAALAIKATHTDHFLMEKVAPGYEIGIDAFVAGGELKAVWPHTKYVIRSGGVTIPGGHGFPFPAEAVLAAEIRKQVENIISATGIDNSAINIDAMVDGDDVWILEAGGRSGATGIPELISIYTGVDYYEQILRTALGVETDFEAKTHTPCIAKLLVSRKSGTVRSIDWNRIRLIEEESRADISLDIAEGSEVHAVHDGTDRIGQVIMRTESEEDVDRVVREVMECLTICILPVT